MIVNIPLYYSNNVNDNIVKYIGSTLQKTIFFYYYDQIVDLLQNKSGSYNLKLESTNFIDITNKVKEMEETYKIKIDKNEFSTLSILNELHQQQSVFSKHDDIYNTQINRNSIDINNKTEYKDSNNINKNKTTNIKPSLSSTLKNTTNRTINLNRSSTPKNKSGFDSRSLDQKFSIMNLDAHRITDDSPTWLSFDIIRKGEKLNRIVGIKSIPIKFKTNSIIYTLTSDFKKKSFHKTTGILRKISQKIYKIFNKEIPHITQDPENSIFADNRLSAIFYSLLDFENETNKIAKILSDQEILAKLRIIGWKLILFDNPIDQEIYILIPYGKYYFYKQTVSYQKLASEFRVSQKIGVSDIYKNVQSLKDDLSKIFAASL